MKNNLENRLKVAREQRYRPELDLKKIIKVPEKSKKDVPKEEEEEKGNDGVFAT